MKFLERVKKTNYCMTNWLEFNGVSFRVKSTFLDGRELNPMLTIRLVDNGIDITEVQANSTGKSEIKLNGNAAKRGSLYQVRAIRNKDGIQNELKISASSFDLNG